MSHKVFHCAGVMVSKKSTSEMPGGVDENVNMPEFFFGVRPHALACGGVGKVAADGIGFDAV